MQGCIMRFLLDLPPSLSCFALPQLETMTSGGIRCTKTAELETTGIKNLFKGGLRDGVLTKTSSFKTVSHHRAGQL